MGSNRRKRLKLMAAQRRGYGGYRDQKQYRPKHKVAVRLDCWLFSPTKKGVLNET